ncbi:hypothetical protein ACFL09_05230 [Planctomycetota bacterium]
MSIQQPRAPADRSGGYAQLCERVERGDREAIRECHEFHRHRALSTPPSVLEAPDASTIADAFDAWRAEGGVDKPIAGEEAP